MNDKWVQPSLPDEGWALDDAVRFLRDIVGDFPERWSEIVDRGKDAGFTPELLMKARERAALTLTLDENQEPWWTREDRA